MWARHLAFSVKPESRNGFKEAEALTLNANGGQQKLLNDLLLASNTLRQRVEETNQAMSQSAPRITGSMEKAVGGIEKEQGSQQD